MATRALQQVVSYLAWNTSTNAYVTGDVANHSTSWSKDGTRSATTNSPAETDATNMPGLYKVTMTSTETDCIEGVLGGKSSTANVVLIPTMVAFDYLNTSAPATAGIPDVNVKNINNAAAATPGASGGILISGSNSGTTTLGALTVTNALTVSGGAVMNGVAASGSTPATAGLTITGGAASTTGGGVSAAAIVMTGGAGAASTNGAAAGMTSTAGGTTTVSGNDGAKFTGTGNGNGLTAAKAGSGQDFNATSTPLTLAKTTNITGFNDIAATSVVSSGAITTSGGAVSNVTTVTGNVNGSVGSVTGAVGSVTGNVGGTTADFTTQLTESYRANGAAPTPAQALSEIIAHLGESVISGTTKTIKKLDHSTTAETFTLDSATTPASITRAT